jgi:phosphatidate cytidylyltransferase
MTGVHHAADKQPQDRSNLITRSISAFIGGPIVLFVTYLGGVPFLVIGLAAAVLIMLEFCALGAERSTLGNLRIGLPAAVAVVLAFVAGQFALVIALFIAAGLGVWLDERLRRAVDAGTPVRVGLTLAGLAYAALPVSFLVTLRNLPNGMLWIFLLYGITWGTDTLAFFGGRLWGKHPLAPRISPKKSVEGAVVGMVGGFIIALLILAASGQLRPELLPLALFGPPLAVIGDLFESWLKRRFQVGDSHIAGLNIIPGHGGVLDRTDSLVWVTSFCAVYFFLIGLMA